MGSKGRKKSQKKQEYEEIIESDDTVAFIVGYTSGGFPYGVTWEEMGYEDPINSIDDKDLPFD